MQLSSTKTDTAPKSAALSFVRHDCLPPSAAEEGPPEGPLCQSLWEEAASESFRHLRYDPAVGSAAAAAFAGAAAWGGDAEGAGRAVPCRGQLPPGQEVDTHLWAFLPAAALSSAVPIVGERGGHPVSACGGNCHPAGEYSGYTWSHLPIRFCSAPEFSSVEAIPAIFAARIAFSSFATRPRLK